MTVESFAQNWRLKTRLDECGDKIIPGKRGHLYFDGDSLCLMVLDGAVALPRRWQALGGKLWMGDVSSCPKTGRRVQDVKIAGISLENATLAIRMVRAFPRRILSPEELARRQEMARKNLRPPSRWPSSALESIGKARSDS